MGAGSNIICKVFSQTTNHPAYHFRVSRQSMINFYMRREITMNSQYSDYTGVFYIYVLINSISFTYTDYSDAAPYAKLNECRRYVHLALASCNGKKISYFAKIVC
jgi:hypothetical protein